MDEQYKLLVLCIALVVVVGTVTIVVPVVFSSSTPIYDANHVRVEVITSGSYSMTVTADNVPTPITGTGDNTYTFSHTNNLTTYWQILVDYSEGSSHPVTIRVTDTTGNVLVTKTQDSGRMVFWVDLNAISPAS